MRQFHRLTKVLIIHKQWDFNPDIPLYDDFDGILIEPVQLGKPLIIRSKETNKYRITANIQHISSIPTNEKVKIITTEYSVYHLTLLN